MPEQKRYARIKPHLKMENISFHQAPRGGPRQFSRSAGYIPVPKATELFLSGIYENGEPLERGGEGSLMFEFVNHDELLRNLERDNRLARAKAIGKAAYQSELVALEEENRRLKEKQSLVEKSRRAEADSSQVEDEDVEPEDKPVPAPKPPRVGGRRAAKPAPEQDPQADATRESETDKG